jgi:hypothetical protein
MKSLALGRPGKDEPDFILFPREPTRQFYGVIELKTPQSTILTRPRKSVVSLSRTASTAVAQAQIYLPRLAREITWSGDVMFLGARHYAFIIMGRTEELRRKLTSQLLRSQLPNLLPHYFQILPYDYVYRLFTLTVPSRIMMLVAEAMPRTDTMQRDSPLSSKQLVRIYAMRFESVTRHASKLELRETLAWMVKNAGVVDAVGETADDGSYDIRRISVPLEGPSIESFVSELRAFMRDQSMKSSLSRVWVADPNNTFASTELEIVN